MRNVTTKAPRGIALLEADLRRRWSAMIDNAPFESISPAKLRSIVKAMRSFSSERDEGKITLQKYRELAMNLLCDAIGAGAFAGPEWIKFRTRLAGDPSFENAVKFLETDTPQAVPIIKAIMEKPDDGTFQLSAYIDRFAEQIRDNGFSFSNGVGGTLYFGGQGSSAGRSDVIGIYHSDGYACLALPPDRARGLAEYILNRLPAEPGVEYQPSVSYAPKITTKKEPSSVSPGFWRSIWRAIVG